MIESATFWKDGPEIALGELGAEDIETEVFFLPAAAHTEKSGSFTQTQRMLQWHHQAVQPAGDCRASCGSSTTSVAGSGSGWPTPPTSGTDRCSTWRGTTRCTGSTASPVPRPC